MVAFATSLAAANPRPKYNIFNKRHQCTPCIWTIFILSFFQHFFIDSPSLSQRDYIYVVYQLDPFRFRTKDLTSVASLLNPHVS